LPKERIQEDAIKGSSESHRWINERIEDKKRKEAFYHRYTRSGALAVISDEKHRARERI